MSGICGLFQLDGAPVAATDLRAMTAMLERRGPERTGRWQKGSTELGHTLLATTPELQFERQPFEHQVTGCVITADVRLDNRDGLNEALAIRRPIESTGDAELILLAYLTWGEDCVKRLLGDFAFAIWDPRQRLVFCARDHFGMRPLYYHHMPDRHFVFASDARAILLLQQVPYRINDGRIADFLVPELEWIDYTSTFFENVFRLPPGHKCVVSSSRIEVAEYWHPQPGPGLGPMSDDDYRQGFVEVFTEAIEARLRAPSGAVGSMLSGGMDSGSVVAFAKEVLNSRDEGPLPTFSAVQRGPTGNFEDLDCPESKAIYAASTMPSITPTFVYPDAVADFYETITSAIEEPFDSLFGVLMAIFLKARSHGIKAVLDGGGGDMALNEGTHILRLIRQGEVRSAIAEIIAGQEYWERGSPMSSLLRFACSAATPEVLKHPLRAFRYRRNLRNCVKKSLISPNFARSVDIEVRIERMREIFPTTCPADYAVEYCEKIWPNMTAGRERYARLAAATGVEARDPFMDKRVIDYCSRLPGRFRLRNGWPKIILRDILAGTLPREVLWTRRKPHLGWIFTAEVNKLAAIRGDLDLSILEEHLDGYVDSDALASAWQDFRRGGDSEQIFYAFMLSVWLRRTVTRPVVAGC